MITVALYRNAGGAIYGFKADDHGESLVCAAVSTLSINAVNSVETFTDLEFTCDFYEEGGFLSFELPAIKAGAENRDAHVLLESLRLGLKALENDYFDEIRVIEEVQQCSE